MTPIPDSEENYVFHSLLSPEDVVEAEAYDFAHLLEKARSQLKSFDGSIDGIVTFWEFPFTVLRAVLCEELGLPGPSAQSMVKCAHK